MIRVYKLPPKKLGQQKKMEKKHQQTTIDTYVCRDILGSSKKYCFKGILATPPSNKGLTRPY